MKKFSKGFTLAEVLITLAVIGVVAALTMPVIYAKIERHILNNRFKKMYSTLSQVLEKTLFDKGYNMGCYVKYPAGGGDGLTTEKHDTSGCKSFFINDFPENLRVLKLCENNAYTNGCLPNYDWGFAGSSGCSGFDSDNIKTKSIAIVLSDGSIIFTYGIDNPITTFGIDINGKKGPNKSGYDIYSLNLVMNDNGNSIKLSGQPFKGRPVITNCLPATDDGGVKYLDEIMK